MQTNVDSDVLGNSERASKNAVITSVFSKNIVSDKNLKNYLLL